MFGNPAAERAAIETLYDAVCSISRGTATAENSIARVKLETVAENIPCGLSAVSDSSAQEEANRISDEKELFVAPETDIRAGDSVTVEACGRKRCFEAVGVPVVYATHQQVRLIGKDLA